MSASTHDGLEARILELLWQQRERAEDTQDGVSNAGLTISEITRELNLGQADANRVGQEQVAPVVRELLARGTIGEDQATPGHWIHRGTEA